MLTDSWRWFGMNDPISLKDIKMTGVHHIVTALHEIPIGDVWPLESIMAHKNKIEEEGMHWYVAESLSLHETIKYGGEERDHYIDLYIQSMINLSKAGIKVICYNFMPIVDWTRTDLKYLCEDGSYALRFDWLDFAILDIYILKREGVENDYTKYIQEKAKEKVETMSEKDMEVLKMNVINGLPGGMIQTYTLDQLKKILSLYKQVSKEDMCANISYFLKRVIPIAEKCQIYFAIHPDDPPIDLFGIPRIVSSQEDIRSILNVIDSPYNGITLCVGTLASHPKNRIMNILGEFSHKVHFLHMRNVLKDKVISLSFTESNHLEGDVDMYYIFYHMKNEKRPFPIYYRADHGHLMLDDISKNNVNPGYSLIGRLRGISELRGVFNGVFHG